MPVKNGQIIDNKIILLVDVCASASHSFTHNPETGYAGRAISWSVGVCRQIPRIRTRALYAKSFRQWPCHRSYLQQLITKTYRYSPSLVAVTTSQMITILRADMLRGFWQAIDDEENVLLITWRWHQKPYWRHHPKTCSCVSLGRLWVEKTSWEHCVFLPLYWYY
jgi:hypothetical protein